MFKKNDVTIIISALILAGLIYTGLNLLPKTNAEYFKISVDGKEYMAIQKNETKKVEIVKDGRRNVISFSDSKAKMIDANCPDKLCVHQGELKSSAQTIVCLPNKVVVELVGKKTGIDSISE